MQRVNAYIADARGLVNSNPDDEEGRQALMEAYQQKAMLYKMAMRHSLP
jgi:DNA-binding SARP family transcriptional activator